MADQGPAHRPGRPPPGPVEGVTGGGKSAVGPHDGPGGTSARPTELEDQVAELAAEARRLDDRWRRAMADLDNLRKRTDREVAGPGPRNGPGWWRPGCPWSTTSKWRLSMLVPIPVPSWRACKPSATKQWPFSSASEWLG